MKSWFRFQFTIRTLLIGILISAIAIFYFQPRTVYILRVPNTNVFYGLLEPGDKIAILSRDGDTWKQIRRSVRIESQESKDQYDTLTVSLAPREWREIFRADMMGRLGICLRGDYDNPAPL